MRPLHPNALFFSLLTMIGAACGPSSSRTVSENGEAGSGSGSGNTSTEGTNSNGGETTGDDDGRVDRACSAPNDNISQEVTSDITETATVATPSSRASVLISPQALGVTATITIESQPLSNFVDEAAVINGIYKFGPSELALNAPVTVTLPLNGYEVGEVGEVEIVRWDDPSWIPVAGTRSILGDDEVSGDVSSMGTYGLRFIAGAFPGGDCDPFGETGGGIEQSQPIEGMAWFEKKVIEIFAEPRCDGLENEMLRCNEWLAEHREAAGQRWRVGSCHVWMQPGNPGWPVNRARPPIEWTCQLRGEYVKLVEAGGDQDMDFAWEFERMYEGRFCEKAEDPFRRRECEAWIGEARGWMDGQEALITSAACIQGDVPRLNGARQCRLLAHIGYFGFPPDR